jgi:phenylpropionate dioxygenase-like ring-hydroxylating dioxygenase large terminal subunit
MDRTTEISLIKEIIGLAEQKSAYLDETIAHSPISRYASPERFERERSALFRRHPMIVAHSSELEGPQAFLTKEFLDLPVLLVRDGDGKVNAFLNVCRHRGAKLVREASGCKRIFTCPYHAWSWCNDGALRGVPHEDQGFPDLPRAERGLRRLPRCRSSWVHLDYRQSGCGGHARYRCLAGGNCDRLQMAGHGRSQGRRHAETLEIKANWKVLVEGGLEAYHFRVAHKNTIGPYFTDNLLTYRMFGRHIRIGSAAHLDAGPHPNTGS